MTCTYTVSYRIHKTAKVVYHHNVQRPAVEEFQRQALDSDKFAWFYVEREGGEPFKGQDKQVEGA